MSSEEFIRYLSSLVGVAGLVILALNLGSKFGPWAAGATLLITGGAIGTALWRKHFDAMDRARVSAAWQPARAKEAKEDFPA